MLLRSLLVLILSLVVACGAPSAPRAPLQADIASAAPPAGDARGSDATRGLADVGGDARVPVSARDPSWGDATAPVTLVVFSDFQCPFCGRLVPTLDRLKESYGARKLRIVWKNQPLDFHAMARPAAEAARGVFELGGAPAFWAFHDRVFAGQQGLSRERLLAWAAEVGVDARAVARGLDSAQWKRAVDDDVALADRLGVRGTPATFVNGELLSGAQPYERFRDAVEAELEATARAQAAGTPAHRVYTARVAERFREPAPPDAPEADEAPSAGRDGGPLWKVPVGKSPTLGSAKAPVTLIVFSDFQCPFCKRVEATLTQLRADYGADLRIVWKNQPLPFHPRAEPAAQLAMEAYAQRGAPGFWEAHDRIFESAPKLEDADLMAIATAMKLDAGRVRAAISGHKHKAALDADRALADDVEVEGTPHFFVNGRRLVGARPIAEFKAAIDRELRAASSLAATGAPGAALYDRIIASGKTREPPPSVDLGAPPKGAPSKGPANAKVVIQEVADFECPFCARAEGTIADLMKDYAGKVRVVWRDKPLPMHAHAVAAAELAREAYAQKGNAGFWAMHKLLFDNQRALERDDLLDYARRAGLDVTRAERALDDHRHRAAIDADVAATTAARIHGTPAFSINGYLVSGAQPLAKMKRVVELALKGPAPKPAAPAPTALRTTDLAPGSGAAVKVGDRVTVHYVGKLEDGTEFDSSRAHGQPFDFEVGQHFVIRGFEDGVVGMKVGGRRRVVIPPDQGYGERGVPGKIPPGSTLIFELELVAIR